MRKADMTRVAEKLFGRVNIDRFLLEYDDERSGTFAPLRFVPTGKTVVLGLIQQQAPATGKWRRTDCARIQQATDYVPLERLSLKPAMRFCFNHGKGNLLTEEEQSGPRCGWWWKRRIASGDKGPVEIQQSRAWSAGVFWMIAFKRSAAI